MGDLIDRGNIRDVVLALVFAGLVALLAWTISGCYPQRSANLMPLGSSMKTDTLGLRNNLMDRVESASRRIREEGALTNGYKVESIGHFVTRSPVSL